MVPTRTADSSEAPLRALRAGHATLVQECKEQFETELAKGGDFRPCGFVTCVGEYDPGA